MKKRLPTAEELQKAWMELKRIHREHLAIHGVKISEASHYSESNKAIWLSVLWHYKGEEIYKDHISEIVQRDRPGFAKDQQVRHLKSDGWEIGPKKGSHKLDPYQPSLEFFEHGCQKNRPIENR